MTDEAEVERLRGARERVLERIATACARVGRNPADVTLVAVTKTVEPERIRAAIEAGLTTLGENRVQEAAAKMPGIRGAAWHLIGPLQSNKARRAIDLFDMIETVDSIELATRLDRLAAERGAGPIRALVQVNVDRDPAKAGFEPSALEAAVAALADLINVRFEGLMTVGRLVGEPEQARPTFRSLRELGEAIHARESPIGPGLSMGMSDDYAVAVEEGATIVRVGRAIFGERHPDRA